jgi:hypothetical protein
MMLHCGGMGDFAGCGRGRGGAGRMPVVDEVVYRGAYAVLRVVFLGSFGVKMVAMPPLEGSMAKVGMQ